MGNSRYYDVYYGTRHCSVAITSQNYSPPFSRTIDVGTSDIDFGG